MLSASSAWSRRQLRGRQLTRQRRRRQSSVLQVGLLARQQLSTPQQQSCLHALMHEACMLVQAYLHVGP